MSERGVLYVDTSAVLRAVLESGVSPAIEARIAAAEALVTSRLALVESSRAVLRLRQESRLSETALADAEREIESFWRRCEVFELTSFVCTLAASIAPQHALRTLDALHAATFVVARRRLGDVELVTADERLRRAVETSLG